MAEGEEIGGLPVRDQHPASGAPELFAGCKRTGKRLVENPDEDTRTRPCRQPELLEVGRLEAEQPTSLSTGMVLVCFIGSFRSLHGDHGHRFPSLPRRLSDHPPPRLRLRFTLTMIRRTRKNWKQRTCPIRAWSLSSEPPGRERRVDSIASQETHGSGISSEPVAEETHELGLSSKQPASDDVTPRDVPKQQVALGYTVEELRKANGLRAMMRLEEGQGFRV